MSSPLSSDSEYIPLGCLVLSSTSNVPLDPGLFSPELYDQWHVLLAEPNGPVEASPNGHIPPLQREHQRSLLKSLALARLLELRWIRLEYKVSVSDGEPQGILRVYVLPDDVRRSVIDRTDATFHKSRKTLLSKLDFSNQTWLGHPSAEPQPHPQLHDPVPMDDDIDSSSSSLLKMFNTIKAPDPKAEQARDPYLRYVINNLLESSIEGLTSQLYPYQRRSAATMALREVQPEQFLDPRLVHVKDQNGDPWYYDAPAGVVYRESRSYDGVSGGILAEQMGAGKTVICLALVLATRPTPTPPPPYRALVQPVREHRGVASLADMAAACVTRHGLPYRWQFDVGGGNHTKYTRCLEALERNPGVYEVPREDPSYPKPRFKSNVVKPPKKVLISQTSFITAPQNLLQQWQEEIAKHTAGLTVLVLDQDPIRYPPRPQFLAQHDIVLCSHSRLEQMVRQEPQGPMENNNLTHIHFKRCIVDEGHRLGNSSINAKSDFHRGLDALHVTAKWIVTGTPSRGLYGVDHGEDNLDNASSNDQEKWDLEKVGAIAKFYLKARPWANTLAEGERPADWRVYVLQPLFHGRGANGHNTLRDTLNSLIVRHPLSQLTHMYPSIDEKITVLEGSYQDKLALDVFSMIIAFNSVQSQRTDMDYFFHPRGRAALMLLVRNLKQAGFFGGGFFSKADIATALDTAKSFLEKKSVPISEEDDALMRAAIRVGEVAIKSAVKHCSNDHHELPILIKDFLPDSAAAEAWSFDVGEKDDHLVCTNAVLVVAAQKLIRQSLGDQSSMNTLLNGQLVDKGKQEKSSLDKDEEKAAAKQGATNTSHGTNTMAGNTKLGVDRSSTKTRTNALNVDLEEKVKLEANEVGDEIELPEEFRKAHLVATASAKMTYLMESVLRYQGEEQIIIFYENDNTAFSVSGMLDVIQVPYLIYDKSLTTERKARYIHTFNNDDKFRVLLMDIGQAAYGLDMRAASRIYFLTPVLNPQVQAQAIGRVRRISQQKPVSVETLVLRGSIEEVILQRKTSMSAAEHWRVKTLLDDQPIYEWIRNPRIRFDSELETKAFDQFMPLKHPQPIFGKTFGHVVHPDADIMDVEVHTNGTSTPRTNGVKRGAEGEPSEPLARRVRFA